jgi:amino acid adenylation domain-containing protein
MTPASLLLHDLMFDSARRVPAKTAITSGRETITYGELADRVTGLATTFAHEGIERGDRIVIFAENGIDTVIAFWAALVANAVPVILHPQTKAEKLAYVIADTGARALVVEARLEASVPPPCPPLVFVIGSGRWMDAIASRGAAPPRRCLDIDLAALIYTSGSTGEPKGVMLTHRNMLAATASISEYLEIQEDEVILCVLPLAFGYGLYQIIMALAAGARVVLERSFAFPAETLNIIARERVTGVPGVPTMFAALLAMKSIESFDRSSVRFVTNAAAALPVKHALALRTLFPNAKVFSMYGLTECKRCTYLPPKDLERKPDSVGIAIPNTELWIVDEHDRRLGAGEVGQLVIRGATVMRGYWNKPEATARSLRPGPLPNEYVLYTGDQCKLDEEGYLYFVARTDDVIKSRGDKVPPKAVETALLDICGVREAAVIGVPDELLGSAVKAFVVLEPGVVLDATALQRECRARLESYMVPSEIVLRDELPKNANGKIQKTKLM